MHSSFLSWFFIQWESLEDLAGEQGTCLPHSIPARDAPGPWPIDSCTPGHLEESSSLDLCFPTSPSEDDMKVMRSWGRLRLSICLANACAAPPLKLMRHLLISHSQIQRPRNPEINLDINLCHNANDAIILENESNCTL